MIHVVPCFSPVFWVFDHPSINHRRKPSDKVWYLDKPLGKNEIQFVLFALEISDSVNLNKDVSFSLA